MRHPADDILAVLDACAESYHFPMLDNGYVYLADTRLALFRSEDDWAMVIEVFGYMPRAGLPDVTLFTFGSKLHGRKTPADYVSQEAYENYLRINPNNEYASVWPIEDGDWISEDLVTVNPDVKEIVVRGRTLPMPDVHADPKFGISPDDPPEVTVAALCRHLAGLMRDEILATEEEQRTNVPPELEKILQLEEWRHPDLIEDESPSDVETFRQLARVLETGDVSLYQPSEPPNTHWENWPGGGTL